MRRARIPGAQPNPVIANGRLRRAGAAIDVVRWNPACFQFPVHPKHHIMSVGLV